MKATTKYTIIGLILITINIVMVLLGEWLGMPAVDLVDLPITMSQRVFDITIGVITVATIVWWAPASLIAIVSVIIAEHWQISKVFSLIPTIGILLFQPKIGGWIWAKFEDRIKSKGKFQSKF